MLQIRNIHSITFSKYDKFCKSLVNVTVGLLGLGVHYLPVAQVGDKDLSDEEKSSSEETVLMNKKVSFGHNSSREWVEDECVLG